MKTEFVNINSWEGNHLTARFHYNTYSTHFLTSPTSDGSTSPRKCFTVFGVFKQFFLYL